MSARWLAISLLAACGGHGVHGSIDGAVGDDTGGDATGTASRCTATADMITCTSESTQIDGRTVTYQVPLGDPPAAGWPAVIYYQGSFVPGSHAFAAAKSDAFDQYALTGTVKELLDRGYAVIAPDAGSMGYWQTNIPPYATSWTGSSDDQLVRDLLAAMGSGTFGPIDPARRYAMGISSGGFMTSRMAVSYAGTFRALAIASASYATCSNTCSVPALPSDHPPTLFLHGGSDNIVPTSAMVPYRDALLADGHVAQSIIDPNAGHEWLTEGVTAVPDWFDTHN